MLDSLLSYDIKITLRSNFWRKNVTICHHVRNFVMDVITFPVYQFYCMALFHSQTRRHNDKTLFFLSLISLLHI